MPSTVERLAAIGAHISAYASEPPAKRTGRQTLWMPGLTFVRTRRQTPTFHFADVDTGPAFESVCGALHLDEIGREATVSAVDTFLCVNCVKALEELAADTALINALAENHRANQPPPAPGETAHAWASDGPPLKNSQVRLEGGRIDMLDCPRAGVDCADVILDVVRVQSGTLDVPRNTFSPLGTAWYARCPACGWTSPDEVSEWGVLEHVRKARP